MAGKELSGDKKEVQYDEKFYDLDDGWIDDDEVGLNEELVTDFINESESQSVATGSAVQDEEARV